MYTNVHLCVIMMYSHRNNYYDNVSMDCLPYLKPLGQLAGLLWNEIKSLRSDKSNCEKDRWMLNEIVER